MPKRSCSTFASGARQFVVHDAFEMIWCLAGSYLSSLTPRTTLKSWPLAGAVMMTFLAPAAMCLAAPSRFVNRPVDSNTTSTPRSFHGSCEGSRNDRTLNSSPSTEMISPLFDSTLALRFPSTESYFSRCASVAALVRSLTATKSIFLSPSAARMMLRPIRPNPPMPTLTAILSPPRQTHHSKRYTLIVPYVSRLQCVDAGGFRAGLPVFRVSGDSLQEVRRQPARTARLSADLLQRRRRGVDLDSRRLGRRSADGACAGRRSQAPLSTPPPLSLDDDDRRSTGGEGELASLRRRRVLLSVRLDVHDPADAGSGAATSLRDDGN